MKNGICVAGNLIVDITYPIERWPRQSELTTITGEKSFSMGGAVCNVIADLAKMDPELPLEALGIIGEDPEGEFILSELGKMKNIGTSLLKKQGTTSYTAVMSDNETKFRTFFQFRGANAGFSEESFNWEDIHADLLHIGYILLLDELDKEDPEYGTKMARLLAHAKERGIKTSIDVVTESGNRFSKLVPPALKYTDYCVINELETQEITGIALRDEKDRLLASHMRPALEKMLELGVGCWAVIHCPEGAWGLTKDGTYAELASLTLPAGYIQGTVGAGDAFCSGVLLGAYEERSIEESIRLGICAAAASLSRQDASSGMDRKEEILKLDSLYRRNQG